MKFEKNVDSNLVCAYNYAYDQDMIRYPYYNQISGIDSVIVASKLLNVQEFKSTIPKFSVSITDPKFKTLVAELEGDYAAAFVEVFKTLISRNVTINGNTEYYTIELKNNKVLIVRVPGENKDCPLKGTLEVSTSI